MNPSALNLHSGEFDRQLPTVISSSVLKNLETFAFTTCVYEF